MKVRTKRNIAFIILILFCLGLGACAVSLASTSKDEKLLNDIDKLHEKINLVTPIEAIETTPEIGKEYVFTSGNYVAGEDFDPGTYTITAVKGNGNVISDNIFSGGINAVMGVEDNELYIKEYKNINLPDETTLEVMGLSVKLVRVK